MTNFFTKYLFISVALFFGLSEIANAQLGSFAERKKFNIESDSISGASDLINFPVLVNVTLPSGDVENANGFDIAFTAGDGTTQLDHDLESYDSGTGELVAWVRFSSLSATTDTQFFIYYGDSGITTDQSTTDTWNSDYQLVMHMDGGATEDDATSNANDGTENGTGGIPTTSGRIGDGRDFERGDSDFISVPDDNSLDITNEITISFWYNPESNAAPDMVTKGTNTSYEATIRGGPRMQFKKEGGSNLTASASFSLSNSTWYYLTYVQGASGRSIYQNGVSINTDGNTTAFSTNGDALQISRSGDAADGIIDEVRISDIELSDDWIATEYVNQLNPSTFITELDDLPSLQNIESTAATYTAGGSAIFITSDLTIGSHPTVTTLDSAVIQISNNLDNPDDQLDFSDQLGITGTYTAATGKLLLSGTTSLANYQTALRAVTFNSLAGTPSQLTRTVSITGYKGSSATNTPVRDIDIIIALTDLTTDISNIVFHFDAQDLDGDGTANSAEGSPPINNSSVTLWGDLSTNNFDFTTGTAAIFDSLGFGERGAVEYDGVDDELQKGAETSINNSIFSQKAFALTFRTGNDISGFQVIYEQASGARGYNFSTVDGNLYAHAYSRGDANWGGANGERHRVIDLGLVLPNESYILIAYHNSNEWAAQVNNGFLESFDNAAEMPAVSENVALGGNSGNTRHPITLANENGNFNGQIVEFASWNTSLNGGQRASLYNYFNDKWGNVPPVLSSIEGTNLDFTEGDPDTQITNTITVSDSDPHNNMDSAKVSITTNFITGQDSLIFANTANITGTYNGTTGVLLLSGSDTKTNYQTALRSIKYRNSSINPATSTRTIEFEIYDWDDVSSTVSRNVNITNPDATPVLANIESGDLAYTEGNGAVAITSAITVSDVDDTNIESATISITANYFIGEDFLDFTDTGNISGSFASGSGILTLTGSDTKSNYQTALRAVTYENTSSDPVTLDRTISFVINDGDNNSNTQNRDVTVATVNSKPVLSSIESSNIPYPDAAVQITNTIVASDPDDTRLDSAFVIISENLKPAEDSLIYSTLFGIMGSWNPNTGILKLTGNNLLSDYEAALRSVDYINTATIASGPERVVSFIVSDGDLKSDTLKRTIDVSPVETIPDLEVWLRADAGISEGNGVAITTWEDQSGNGNDYTGTAGSGTAPTFVASSATLNSKPSVNFIGNGDHFLDSDGQTNYINGNNEFSMFIVYKSDVTNTDKGLFIADSPSGADEILTIRYDASGANGGGSFNDVVKTGILGNGADNQLESFSDIQTSGAQIISLQWESGTTYDLYVDGILNNPSSAADPPPSGTITTATTALLGKGGKDTGNNSWDGEIAEFIFYSRSISQTERESIEDYLADKYDQAIRKITPAIGGESISADDANTTYTSLTGPFIQEGFIGEFTSSGTIVLNAPSGYQWNTSGTIGVTESPAFGGSTELDASFTSITSNTATFTIDVVSSTNPGQLQFTGLEIRPTTGTMPNTGNIINSGTTGQGGATNYGTITMVPGLKDSLVFVQQPTTTSKDSIITPEVRVQLVDQHGNSVEEAGISIGINLFGGAGILSGTTSTNTNALGIAEFDDLSIDDVGTDTLQATSAGLTSSLSSSFNIVNDGVLTGFIVERVPSGNISSKTAGQSFNIKITAVDGSSTTVTSFNGTVVISSNCTMDSGQGTSSVFSSGELASTTVSITSTGSCTITATNSAGSEFGNSNSFSVSAGAASEVTSIISASPTVILNNGSSTSVITVDVKDEFGNNITIGGDAITLSTTAGTLASTSGSIIDNSDGTYSDTLTSTMVEEIATISGTVNSTTITDNALVEFAAFTHIWESQLGSASLASDWEETGNWNVGNVPGTNSVVFIPLNPAVGNEQPVIDVTGSTVASVTMETGASLSISGGINFTITGNLSGGSVLGTNADSITVGGDILDVSAINVGTVVMNGTSAQSITNPHAYTNLVIDNANGVTVEENLAINDSLIMTSGELLIPSGKNLVVDGIRYGTGTLRFQRKISGVRGWRILSSPVSSTFGDFLDGTLTQGFTGSTLGNATLDSLQPNVLTYLESFEGTDNQRYRSPGNVTDPLVQGQGIFVFFFGDIAADARYNDPLPDTLDVSGQEFNGTAGEVDFGVTYTANADTGWNLVGNPFGATINWDDSPNWTKTNIENTIYIWDPAANGGNGEYLTWNGTTGTLGSGLIPPFQGFWIKANGSTPVLKVTTDSKTTGGSFLRKEIRTEQTNDVPLLTLELTSNGLKKDASFMFTDNASESKDNFDAFELLPFTESRLEIFSLLDDGTPLVINNLPLEFTNRYLLPVNINGYKEGIPISGDFKIRGINLDNIPDEWLISLIDNETDEEIDLINQEEYTFFHSTKSKAKVANPNTKQKVIRKKVGDARFTLKITTEEIELNIPEQPFLSQNYPNPFNPTTTIPFGLDVDSQISLIVYDILGRKVATLIDGKRPAGVYNEVFIGSHLASGVYFYRLSTDSQIYTKRFTLIK
tara:strand:- start:102724 stop:110232 length:7509 start_codon:yes stop_codon:yes gene_type:complete